MLGDSDGVYIVVEINAIIHIIAARPQSTIHSSMSNTNPKIPPFLKPFLSSGTHIYINLTIDNKKTRRESAQSKYLYF